ncbi:MAG: PilZ domain-containing protein [Methylococcales bacterium]|nr:PilZ domain-containing protein [Methylococcales bacterium]MBT7410538.1 PilZ domain-containing protein [Methylococcales bacterium]
MDNDNRKNLRVSMQLPCELLVGQDHMIGSTVNISLYGALIKPDNTSIFATKVNQQGKIWIQLSEDNFLEFKCIVQHIGEHGIGLNFVDNDVKETMKLRKIIEG